MAETLSIISISSFIGAGIFAALTVVLWFLFKIPMVAGDLSGRNARKTIEQMRKNNEKTGMKYFGADSVNIKRGKLTDVMTGSGKNSKTDQQSETGLLNENKAERYQSAVTEILTEHDLVGQGAPNQGLAARDPAIQENRIGREDGRGTSPLRKDDIRQESRDPGIALKVLEEIIYIHTEEVI